MSLSRYFPISILLSVLILLAGSVVRAQEVAFLSTPLWLSVASTTEGQPVRVSTVITKQNEIPIRGEVTFFAAGTKIGATEFSLSASESGKVIAVSWTPAAGTYPITAQITKATSENEQMLSVAKELRAAQSLKVLPDNDRDKISDADDPDDDNDAVSDIEEKKQGSDPLKKEIAKKETAAKSSVLGASTSVSTSSDALITRAVDTAKGLGEDAFEVTEDMRKTAEEYVNVKLKRIEDMRASDASAPSLIKTDATSTSNGEFKPVVEARSFKDQFGDLRSIGQTGYYYALKAASFMTGSVYAFYLIAILFILYILRKIWRRYSLD